MNDVERRLRDLGETAQHQVTAGLRPRPEALRRITRRRLVASTSLFTSAVVIVAAAAFAWSGAADRSVRPADDGRDQARSCSQAPFEWAYWPHGFERLEKPSRSGGRSGVIATYRHIDGKRIEVTAQEHGLPQTRPSSIEVLGNPATLGATAEGWSVEFRFDTCAYVLNAYGITRSRLGRFAERLVPTAESDSAFAAVWPENTIAAARENCGSAEQWVDRRDPLAVAKSFVRTYLAWSETAYEVAERAPQAWTIEVRPGPRVFPARSKIRPGVTLHMKEVLPGCWSVESAGRLPDQTPTGIGISVEGRTVEVAVDGRDATSAGVEIVYGDRSVFRPFDPGERPARFDLYFDPDTTGRFLIVLGAPNLENFTIMAGPLPPGDFTAG